MVENVYDLWQPPMLTTHLSQNRFKSFLPLGQFMDVQSQTWKVIKNKSEPNPSYFHKGSRLWSKKVKCNRTFWKISCCSCAVTAKKCTKTCAARAELLFCLLDLLLFCCPRRRRRLGCFNSVKALMSPRNTTTEDQAHPVAEFAANSSLALP